MKSPLKDISADFTACYSALNQLIDKDATLESHLLYGGSLELALANSGRTLKAHTTQYVVYEFWQCLLQNPQRVYDILRSPFFNFDHHMIPIIQQAWHTYEDPFIRAAFFYALNRGSDKGLISSGEIKSDDFNKISNARLRRFKVDNFDVKWQREDNFLLSLEESLNSESILLLPMGKFSYNFGDYGKNRGPETTLVRHAEVWERLSQERHPWVMLYKCHPRLKSLYDTHRVIKIDRYGRTASNVESTSEVIIANF